MVPPAPYTLIMVLPSQQKDSSDSCRDSALTTSPHFHCSNRFIQWQVKMLKTSLCTAKDAGTSLKMILLELWSAPMVPNMPSPKKIMYNWTIQWPGKPLTPVNMEIIWDYLIARKIIQKKYFDKSHSIRPLSTLDPGQDVLFLSLANRWS